ncbi:MAG TPA: hypothetical protein PLO28_11855 [bacterium]|jgi:hypothetical protein|nr:hypothetical protein [bacterium]
MSILLALLIMIAAVAWVVAPLFRPPATADRSVADAATVSARELLYSKSVAAGIIQELHFDFQTGKLSEQDHAALVAEQEKLIAAIDERLAGLKATLKHKGLSLPGSGAGMILLVLLTIAALPAWSRNATFSGRLLDGSRDSTGVAGEAVALQLLRDDGHPPREVAAQHTGTDGAFSFSIASPDTGAAYLAMVEHQGVRYYSDQASFAAENQARHDIVRFDSSRSNREIAILMHHLFVQDMGEALALRETRVLHNPTAKTILNAVADGHEAGAILLIKLPPWAQNITPIAGRFGTDLHLHGNTLYDAGVFEPGNRQLSFTYELPWQRDRATLVIEVEQPTRSLDLFIGQEGLRLEGEGLTSHGPFTIRGTVYQRYGIENIAPGSRVQLQVVRQPQGGTSLPPWATLAATGVLLLAGITLARSYQARKKPAKK